MRHIIFATESINKIKKNKRLKFNALYLKCIENYVLIILICFCTR